MRLAETALLRKPFYVLLGHWQDRDTERMNIAQWDKAKQVKTTGGIVKLLDMTAKNMMLYVGKFEHGERLDSHSHNPPVEEIYYIISGKAAVSVGEEKKEVSTGGSVYVAPGIRHGIANESNTTLWALFVVSPPTT